MFIGVLDVVYVFLGKCDVRTHWGSTLSESANDDSADNPQLIDTKTNLLPSPDVQQQRARVIYRTDKADSPEFNADQNQVEEIFNKIDTYSRPAFENGQETAREIKDNIDEAKSQELNVKKDQVIEVLDTIQNHDLPEFDKNEEIIRTISDQVKRDDSLVLKRGKYTTNGLEVKQNDRGIDELNAYQDTVERLQETTNKADRPDLDDSHEKFLEVIDRMETNVSPEMHAGQDKAKEVLDKRERRQLSEKETINEHCKSMKFIVYACLKEDHCGGWGDKQTGIIAAYLLAKMMRRKFVIQDGTCGISTFLIPNTYNWNMCQEYVSSVSTVRTLTFDFYNYPDEYSSLIDNLDPQKFPITQVIFIRTNRLWNDLILYNLGKDEDGDASLGKTVSKVSDRVLGMLFKPVDNIQIGMKNFRKQFTDTKKLICADIYGNKPYSELAGIEMDTSIHASAVNVITAFLNVFDNPSRYNMYVASSSEMIQDHFDGMMLDDIKIDSLTDRIDKSFTKNAKPACKQLLTEILEQMILAECDILLLTNSNLGTMASYTSGKTQSLFYFIDEGQTIVKITKDEIQNYNKFPNVLEQD